MLLCCSRVLLVPCCCDFARVGALRCSRCGRRSRRLWRVKLCDVGLCVDSGSLGRGGTRYALCPEYYSSEPLGPPADMWAVGILVAQMFRCPWVTTLQRNMRELQRAMTHGDRPAAHEFLRTSLASLDVSVMNERPADMPTRVFMLALQCMHMTPSQRPTAAEWVRSLRRLLDAWPEHEAELSPAIIDATRAPLGFGVEVWCEDVVTEQLQAWVVAPPSVALLVGPPRCLSLPGMVPAPGNGAVDACISRIEECVGVCVHVYVCVLYPRRCRHCRILLSCSVSVCRSSRRLVRVPWPHLDGVDCHADTERVLRSLLSQLLKDRDFCVHHDEQLLDVPLVAPGDSAERRIAAMECRIRLALERTYCSQSCVPSGDAVVFFIDSVPTRGLPRLPSPAAVRQHARHPLMRVLRLLASLPPPCRVLVTAFGDVSPFVAFVVKGLPVAVKTIQSPFRPAPTVRMPQVESIRLWRECLDDCPPQCRDIAVALSAVDSATRELLSFLCGQPLHHLETLLGALHPFVVTDARTGRVQLYCASVLNPPRSDAVAWLQRRVQERVEAGLEPWGRRAIGQWLTEVLSVLTKDDTVRQPTATLLLSTPSTVATLYRNGGPCRHSVALMRLLAPLKRDSDVLLFHRKMASVLSHSSALVHQLCCLLPESNAMHLSQDDVAAGSAGSAGDATLLWPITPQCASVVAPTTASEYALPLPTACIASMSVSFGPLSPRVIVGGNGGEVSVLDVTSAGFVTAVSPRTPSHAPVVALWLFAFSPLFWRCATFSPLTGFEAFVCRGSAVSRQLHTTAVRAVLACSFAPNKCDTPCWLAVSCPSTGLYVACCGRGDIALLHCPNDGDRGPVRPPELLCWADNVTLVTYSAAEDLCVWRVAASGLMRCRLAGERGRGRGVVTAVGSCVDGSSVVIAFGHADGTVQMLQYTARDCAADAGAGAAVELVASSTTVVRAHSCAVSTRSLCLTFLGSQLLVVSGGEDGTVSVSSVATRCVLRSFHGASSTVQHLYAVIVDSALDVGVVASGCRLVLSHRACWPCPAAAGVAGRDDGGAAVCVTANERSDVAAVARRVGDGGAEVDIWNVAPPVAVREARFSVAPDVGVVSSLSIPLCGSAADTFVAVGTRKGFVLLLKSDGRLVSSRPAFPKHDGRAVHVVYSDPLCRLDVRKSAERCSGGERVAGCIAAFTQSCSDVFLWDPCLGLVDRLVCDVEHTAPVGVQCVSWSHGEGPGRPVSLSIAYTDGVVVARTLCTDESRRVCVVEDGAVVAMDHSPAASWIAMGTARGDLLVEARGAVHRTVVSDCGAAVKAVAWNATGSEVAVAVAATAFGGDVVIFQLASEGLQRVSVVPSDGITLLRGLRNRSDTSVWLCVRSTPAAAFAKLSSSLL